jgi:hypothetical protein
MGATVAPGISNKDRSFRTEEDVGVLLPLLLDSSLLVKVTGTGESICVSSQAGNVVTSSWVDKIRVASFGVTVDCETEVLVGVIRALCCIGQSTAAGDETDVISTETALSDGVVGCNVRDH